MLQVAYIQGRDPERVKKVSAKQAYHNRMVAELNMQYAADNVSARKKYAMQIAEIEELERKLKSLQSS